MPGTLQSFLDLITGRRPFPDRTVLGQLKDQWRDLTSLDHAGISRVVSEVCELTTPRTEYVLATALDDADNPRLADFFAEFYQCDEFLHLPRVDAVRPQAALKALTA